MPVTNFAAIKREYVEGVNRDGKVVLPTFAELAKKHSTNAANLRRRAGKEGWSHARRKFAAKIAHASENMKAQALGSKAAQLDATGANAAEALLDQCIAALAKKKLSAGERFTVARTIEIAQKVGRVALGQPLDPGNAPRSGDVPPIGGSVEDLKNAREALARVMVGDKPAT